MCSRILTQPLAVGGMVVTEIEISQGAREKRAFLPLMVSIGIQLYKDDGFPSLSLFANIG